MVFDVAVPVSRKLVSVTMWIDAVALPDEEGVTDIKWLIPVVDEEPTPVAEESSPVLVEVLFWTEIVTGTLVGCIDIMNVVVNPGADTTAVVMEVPEPNDDDESQSFEATLEAALNGHVSFRDLEASSGCRLGLT